MAMPLILGQSKKDDADYLDSCRTKRNKVEYDYAGGASNADADELIEFATELKVEVLKWLKDNHPNCSDVEMKYFIYARKSTDDEERHILSIHAQLDELRILVTKEGLQVVHEYIEARTAKEPGRPIFNEMLGAMEKGEAQGILAWHPDRLARNSVDGGRNVLLQPLAAPDAAGFRKLLAVAEKNRIRARLAWAASKRMGGRRAGHFRFL